MGITNYKEGDYLAVCFECGHKFYASELKRHWTGYYVCPRHWEMRQPQDYVRGVPDTQTVPWAQPLIGLPNPSDPHSAIPNIAIPNNAWPNTP